MKIDIAIKNIQSLKEYNKNLDEMHDRRIEENRQTEIRLERIEMERIRRNRELNRSGQHVDKYV